VVAVVEEIDAAGAFAQQECEEGNVGFFGVAWAATQHQVVGPVVGRLALAGTHVVEGHLVGVGFDAAVGANRAVPVD
jgi:hypothetical protein